MGTNYYLRTKPCQICGEVKKEIHIGKSSCGWQFLFKGYKEENIFSYKQWLEEIDDPRKEIINEYGEIVSLDDFRKCVENEKRKNMINHYNTFNKTPHNEAERKYIMEQEVYNDWRDLSMYWKDSEGYTFIETEFS